MPAMLNKAFALGLLAAAAWAALEGRAADDFKAEEGYEVLFNGKDLTGWVCKSHPKELLTDKTETAKKRFEVKDGVIIANAKDTDGKGGIKDLYTTRNFDGDFILKLEFRAAPRADSGVYIRGKQLQVRDYPRAGPYKPKGFKDNDWNELEIVVTGTSALCKCNGEILEKAMKVPAKGGIGLQAESGKFEFRRIRVKEAK